MAAAGTPTPSPIFMPWLLSVVPVFVSSVSSGVGLRSEDVVVEAAVTVDDAVSAEEVVSIKDTNEEVTSSSIFPFESRNTPRLPAQHPGSSSEQQ
jgi:hypothetical protein